MYARPRSFVAVGTSGPFSNRAMNRCLEPELRSRLRAIKPSWSTLVPGNVASSSAATRERRSAAARRRLKLRAGALGIAKWCSCRARASGTGVGLLEKHSRALWPPG